MFIRLLGHARSNVVAYLALVLAGLALAGGAYAALSLPAGSVGARQIRNHSIGPVKLDPRAIGGFVRHWARVDATGTIVASSSRANDNAGTSQIVLIAQEVQLNATAGATIPLTAPAATAAAIIAALKSVAIFK